MTEILEPEDGCFYLDKNDEVVYVTKSGDPDRFMVHANNVNGDFKYWIKKDGNYTFKYDGEPEYKLVKKLHTPFFKIGDNVAKLGVITNMYYDRELLMWFFSIEGYPHSLNQMSLFTLAYEKPKKKEIEMSNIEVKVGSYYENYLGEVCYVSLADGNGHNLLYQVVSKDRGRDLIWVDSEGKTWNTGFSYLIKEVPAPKKDTYPVQSKKVVVEGKVGEILVSPNSEEGGVLIGFGTSDFNIYKNFTKEDLEQAIKLFQDIIETM